MKLLLLLLVACSAPDQRKAPPQPAIERAAPVSTAPSIYDLPIQLRDASDHAISLDHHRGELVVVSMFYASCTTACPVLIAELAALIDEVPPGVKVLLVSFDAARDTPAKLAALAHERHLDGRWTLAAASDADARALAAVLGVKYRKLASGDFAHGATIVALDRDGRPLARTDSLGQRAELVAALSR